MIDPEVRSFAGLWSGGYFEGDPLDPHSISHYHAIDVRNGYPERPNGLAAQEIGYVSVLYATYLATIRRKLPAGATVLEIGPGRGGWTKALLSERPGKIYALDALPADHNGFWAYVGDTDCVEYTQVEDFHCSPVPDQSVDFFFSFGCFCHISRRGASAYFEAISKKMKPGSKGFCMISDYKKLGDALGVAIPTDEPDDPAPGRWYHLGTDWFCDMLEEKGFQVLDRDMEVLVRDPIVHFQR